MFKLPRYGYNGFKVKNLNYTFLEGVKMMCQVILPLKRNMW